MQCEDCDRPLDTRADSSPDLLLKMDGLLLLRHLQAFFAALIGDDMGVKPYPRSFGMFLAK